MFKCNDIFYHGVFMLTKKIPIHVSAFLPKPEVLLDSTAINFLGLCVARSFFLSK